MITSDVRNDLINAARYATTLWDLHLASFRYREKFIFEDRPGPQTVLAVRTWPEAEILLNAAFAKRKPGGMSSLGGRYLSEPGDDNSLQLIAPWDPGSCQGLVQSMHAIYLTLAPDRSNLEELAFQIHREFNFVADILEELYAYYLKGSRIMAGQWRARGWAAIPGYREALGPIGRETSPQLDDDGSFLMGPKDAMDLLDKFLNQRSQSPRPGGPPCKGPLDGLDNQSRGRTP